MDRHSFIPKMAFSQPFTQLSIDLWEDIDLWLPIDSLFLGSEEELKRTDETIRNNWSYHISKSVSLKEFQVGSISPCHWYLFDYVYDARRGHRYRVWYSEVIIEDTTEVKEFFCIIWISYSSLQDDIVLACAQVVRCQSFIRRIVSTILMDIFPKPDTRNTRNRGPQVVI